MTDCIDAAPTLVGDQRSPSFTPAFDQPQLEVALFAGSRGVRQCGQPGVTMGSVGENECPCLFLGNSKKADGVQVIK